MRGPPIGRQNFNVTCRELAVNLSGRHFTSRLIKSHSVCDAGSNEPNLGVPSNLGTPILLAHSWIARGRLGPTSELG